MKIWLFVMKNARKMVGAILTLIKLHIHKKHIREWLHDTLSADHFRAHAVIIMRFCFHIIYVLYGDDGAENLNARHKLQKCEKLFRKRREVRLQGNGWKCFQEDLFTLFPFQQLTNKTIFSDNWFFWSAKQINSKIFLEHRRLQYNISNNWRLNKQVTWKCC